MSSLVIHPGKLQILGLPIDEMIASISLKHNQSRRWAIEYLFEELELYPDIIYADGWHYAAFIDEWDSDHVDCDEIYTDGHYESLRIHNCEYCCNPEAMDCAIAAMAKLDIHSAVCSTQCMAVSEELLMVALIALELDPDADIRMDQEDIVQFYSKSPEPSYDQLCDHWHDFVYERKSEYQYRLEDAQYKFDSEQDEYYWHRSQEHQMIQGYF